MACRNDTLAEDSMARVTGDTLYVAVGKDVKKCRSILLWAIQHSGGDKICILHVHQPAKRLPLLGAKWSAKLLNEKSLKGHRDTERQRMNKILEEYLTTCHENGVQAHSVHTETDNIKKGIVALISQHGIRNLVMGAAADNRYRENMRDPRSRKATYVCIQAPLSCRIQFICKSLLIHTREEGKPLRTRSVSSSPNRKNIEAGPLNLQRSLSVDNLRHNNVNDGGRIMDIPFREGREELLSPKCGLVVEGSRSDESCSYGSSRRSLPGSSYSISPSRELSDVTLNAWTGENANRNELNVFYPKSSLASSSTLINPSASTLPKCSSNGSRSVVDRGLDYTLFGEVQKAKPNAEKETHLRLKAEKDYFEALNMAQEEGKQRIKIEEALVREREELEQVKNQRDQMIEEIRISKEEKTLLKSQNEELKKKRDELQIELDNALKEAEELRRQEVQDSRHMPEFLFPEINKATRGFHESLRIGQGGYGSVYKGLLPQTEVAIKRLQSNGSQGPSEFLMEVQVLGKLRHPNLIKLIGCCSEQFMLIYEYLPNGSLEDRLKCKDNSPPLSWEARIRIATELCSVLVYLHSRKPHSIVHGDLKPSNILLDVNFVSKLSDFGICRMLCHEISSSNNTTACHNTDPKGTWHFIDPEFILTGKLTRKSDVYSFGIILLQLLTGRKPPFKMENDVQVALDAGTLSSLLDPLAGDWPIEIAQNLAHLALMCCDRNRKNRPDLASCVSRELESMKASCVASSSFSSRLQEEISTDGSTSRFFSSSRGFEEMAGL